MTHVNDMLSTKYIWERSRLRNEAEGIYIGHGGLHIRFWSMKFGLDDLIPKGLMGGVKMVTGGGCSWCSR